MTKKKKEVSSLITQVSLNPQKYKWAESKGTSARMGCNKDVAPEATGPRHHEYNAGACHLCESQTLHFYKIIPTAQGSSHFQVMRYRARWELWFKNIKTATKGAPQVLPISQWKVELRMINTKTGTGLRFYSVCFSSKSRALEEQVGTIPSRRNASCRQ